MEVRLPFSTVLLVYLKNIFWAIILICLLTSEGPFMTAIIDFINRLLA